MRKSLLFLLLITSSYTIVFAQSHRVDSLLNDIKTQKVDSCIYNSCIKIAEYYKDSSYDKSLVYYNKALEIAESSRQQKKIADVYHNIGYMYLNKGELPTALSNLTNGLTILEYIHDNEGVGQILNDIGLVYKAWGKYEKAIENFHNALKIFDETGNEKFIAVVSNNIGQIYYYRSEYEKAIPFFTKYFDVNKKNNNPRAVAGAANNIASAYLELGKLDDALGFYIKSMRIYDSLGIKVGVAIIKDNIGSLYIRKKQYHDALMYSSEASNFFEERGNRSRLCASLLNLGIAYGKLNSTDLALKSLTRSLELASILNLLETKKDAYEALAEIYTQRKEYDKALINYKLYSHTKDSLLNSETIGKIETIQAEYESQKKEKELAEVNQKFKSQKNLGLIAAGVITLFLFLTSLIIRENQNKKNLITKSNEKIINLYKVIGLVNKQLLTNKNDALDSFNFFKKHWVAKSIDNEQQFFVQYYNEPNLYFAFLSKGTLTENEEVIKLAVIDFFSTPMKESVEISVKKQFSDFISSNEIWSQFQIEKQIINIDFWRFNRYTFEHLYSGNISAFLVNDKNHITDLSKSPNNLLELKKGYRIFFCASNLLPSFILNDQNTIQNTIYKTIEKSVSLEFEQQKELLENSIEMIEVGNGKNANISILGIQV